MSAEADAEAGVGTESPARNRWPVVGRAIRTNALVSAGLGMLAVVALAAALAPALAPYDPLAQDLGARLLPPSWLHWCGTDNLGRDIWSRILFGSRITMAIVLLAAVTVAPTGLLIGVVAGATGGAVDALLMRATDVFMALPRLVLALATAAALGPGLLNAILAIALTAWPPFARLARAETQRVMSSDFVAAARLQGASMSRILALHVTPLVLPVILARLPLDLSGIILIAAGLGFLGLGAQPPMPEWGAMVASGRDFLLDQWWVATLPGIAILFVSLAFNLLGDGLRDALDPRSDM
jgi:peptide/nickel transport system permease protein